MATYIRTVDGKLQYEIEPGSAVTMGPNIPTEQAVISAAAAAAAAAEAAEAAAEQAMSGTPEGYADLVGSVAETYSSLDTYRAGDYVLHESALYQALVDIDTPEEWTSDHWTAVKIGNELSDLKAELNSVEDTTAVFVQTATVADEYYNIITKLSTSKKYLLIVTVNTAGTYTIQTGTSSSLGSMVDTLATNLAIGAGESMRFYGYVPSVAEIKRVRISSDTVTWSVSVYEIKGAADIVQNASDISTLSGTVQNQGGAITDLGGRITTLENNVEEIDEHIDGLEKDSYNIYSPDTTRYEHYYMSDDGALTSNSHYGAIIINKAVLSGDYIVINTFGKLPTIGTFKIGLSSTNPQVGDTVTRLRSVIDIPGKYAVAPASTANYIIIVYGASTLSAEDLAAWDELVRDNLLVAVTQNAAVELSDYPYLPNKIIDVQEANLSNQIREKLDNVTQTVQYLETKTVNVGSNLLGTATLGTGWTENSGVYTHSSGTDSLEFTTELSVGDIAILDFDTSFSAKEFINVGIGTAYRILCYQDSTHIRVPLKAIGNTTLYMTPFNNFSGSISNITLRKIQDSGTEIELEYKNVLSNNHIDTYGFWNTLLGDKVANNAVGTTRTVAIGYQTLNKLQGGHRHIAIGTFAMSQLIGGERNIAIGADSMLGVSSGNDNIVVGYASLSYGTNVNDNVAIGSKALNAQYQSDASTSSPSENVAIGTNAGINTKSNTNTFVGYRAGYRNKTGNNNTIVGSSLGADGGNNNTFIGAGIASNNSLADSIGLGKSATPTKSNQMMLGGSAITEVVMCGDKKIIFNNDGTVTWEALT